MIIKWLGHACFLITSQSGLKIITDPYTSGGGVKYGGITESADIVTVSHEHSDHNNAEAISGDPIIIKEGLRAKEIDFRCISSYHDTDGGQKRGKNSIFYFELDGIVICHLGDLGHLLNDKQITQLGQIDILFIPVGGYFTIDAQSANQVASQIKPKITIPMHFKTAKLDYPIASVDTFLQDKEGVLRLETSEIEFTKESLPSNTQVIVLKPAL